MRNTDASSPSAKVTRINVRIRPDQKTLIARAARLRHTAVTGFVLDNALHAANQLVAEQRQFEMTPDEFKRFCRALDAPPTKNLQAMQRLLSEPSALDE